MISIKALYTQEANIEAEEQVKKPMTFLDGSGNPSRLIGNDAIVAMYSFTK